MDQQITAVIVNRKEHKLKVGGGGWRADRMEGKGRGGCRGREDGRDGRGTLWDEGPLGQRGKEMR